MGVDIYGLRPRIAKPQPAVPANYDELSNEERQAFWKMHDEIMSESPGYCFRCSWWEWRPLQVMITTFNKMYELGIPEDEIKTLGYNNGRGVTDPTHCELLAMVFQKVADEMKQKNQDNVYMNVSKWYRNEVTTSGAIAPRPVDDKEIIQALDDKHPAFFFTLPEHNGIEYVPSYATRLSTLEWFISFLKECNGFRID